jgi:wyosine [tRNA(Phe)-imidazoG37] synthetase (radical SAM superfamily)
MKYVYGPVPSRRLGQSLGIDPIPLKTCNWNCVYCQLGRTRPVVNERKDYAPPQEILAQVREALTTHEPGETAIASTAQRRIDWVTFVGSGEPMLHAGMGWLIRQVKASTDLPIAVITNGSLLYLPEVREELTVADAVMPSLDAGTAKLYRQINRPHPRVTFERLLDGLIAFRRGYSGKLWVEVMLVQGLNDTEEALRDIADALHRIRPDEVHINLPTRPPAETWVRPPDREGLMRATAILGDIAQVVHPVEGTFDLSGYSTVIEAVVGIITRHPMRQEELERTLAQWTPGRIEQALAELEAGGQAQIVERYGTRFWSAAPSHYPDEAHSQATAPGHRRH